MHFPRKNNGRSEKKVKNLNKKTLKRYTVGIGRVLLQIKVKLKNIQ